MSYSEKLKDPRWQKKRLEIFQRDNFTCQSCESKNETLHVHHLAYEKGKEPWEYDNASLVTLCESCHSLETFERRQMEDGLIEALRRKGYNIADITNLQFNLPEKQFSDETVIKKIIEALKE